ncbi:hypothetical protein AB0E12_13965 [Micromonospora chersina]
MLLGYLIARRPIAAGLDWPAGTRLRPLLWAGGAAAADEAAAAGR